MQPILERAGGLRLMILDVDGVLTDGTIVPNGTGNELKPFNTLDGHGMKLLQADGVRLAIITGRKAPCVEQRASGLGIDLLFQGVSEKSMVFERLLSELDVRAFEAGYVGDDIADLTVMQRCGLSFSVPAAPIAVRRHAHYVTRRHGGEGAVREVCDLLLFARSARSLSRQANQP